MSLVSSASESGEKDLNECMFASKMCLTVCGVENCVGRCTHDLINYNIVQQVHLKAYTFSEKQGKVTNNKILSKYPNIISTALGYLP